MRATVYSDEGGAVAVGASAIAAEARRVSSAQPQLSTRRVSQVVTDSLTAAVDDAAEEMMRLYNLFIDRDATMIEINPMALSTDDQVICMVRVCMCVY